jgi:protein-tyrosine phosphatase
MAMRTPLYWIDGPWPGRLAISPRPRGGDWLEDEIRAWQVASVEVVVSALQSDETLELDLSKEAESCEANGITFLGFSIADRGVPKSAKKTAELIHLLEKDLAEGKNLAIHCRQGVGRSALLAACVLVLSGIEPDKAFERIGQARGCAVPDTAEQRMWVARFAQDWLIARR